MPPSTQIEALLVPSTWLQASVPVRQELIRIFGLKRSSGPVMSVQNMQSVIESDGHTVNDLRKLNVESMQEFTGSKLTDIHKLFNLCVAKVTKPEPKGHTTPSDSTN